MNTLYLSALLHKYAMVLLVLGALNVALVGLFRFSLLAHVLGDGFLAQLMYVLIGSSALYLMVHRDTYLPFLGPSVVPCASLEPREPPGATKDIQVVVEPNKKVMYWAAEPRKDMQKDTSDWERAYGSYENTGVTMSNASGVAILKVREPQAYTVPLRGRIESHVHYRVCGEPGWMSEVRTVSIGEPEPFGDIEDASSF